MSGGRNACSMPLGNIPGIAKRSKYCVFQVDQLANAYISGLLVMTIGMRSWIERESLSSHVDQFCLEIQSLFPESPCHFVIVVPFIPRMQFNDEFLSFASSVVIQQTEVLLENMKL
jgi:hypothetical protein